MASLAAKMSRCSLGVHRLGRRHVTLAMVAGLVACHPGGKQADPGASATRPPTTQGSVPAPATSAPPEVERSCTRDDECAVARIEVSGPYACCPACGTTPGTRAWHAKLQRHCAAHPPAHCAALACPMGPTRAVSRGGRCEATGSGADGGPTLVLDERRCLPAMVCDDWKGCTNVAGNAQDGWFVMDADQVARGEIASLVDNACTSGARCPAAKVAPPPGVVCPPWTTHPWIGPVSYGCSIQDRGECRPSSR